MPRMPRPIVPGQPLHLIQRGNNRTRSFADREDYACYLRVLRDAGKRAGCAIHAYVLMTNHVHLLVTPDTERGPARMMQWIGRGYVRYFNQRHGRTGTLWEGRFRSTLVDSDRYFLACSRYIDLNPVRAGIVADAASYRWSSFRCNARGSYDPLVTPHPAYRALGETGAARQAAYRAMCAVPLDAAVVDAIRHAARRGTVLGSTRCRAELELALQRPLSRRPQGGARRGSTFMADDASADEPGHHRSSTTLTP